MSHPTSQTENSWYQRLFNWTRAAGQSVQHDQTEAQTAQGFISTIRSKITIELVAHVAIIASLIGAIFLAALNGNFVFLTIGVGGFGAEGYLVYQIYQRSLAEKHATLPTQ